MTTDNPPPAEPPREPARWQDASDFDEVVDAEVMDVLRTWHREACDHPEGLCRHTLRREQVEAMMRSVYLVAAQVAARLRALRPQPAAAREAPLLSAEINALPERVRRFVHDLEAICDPAGMVAQIASLTEQRDALLAKLRARAGEGGA